MITPILRGHLRFSSFYHIYWLRGIISVQKQKKEEIASYVHKYTHSLSLSLSDLLEAFYIDPHASRNAPPPGTEKDTLLGWL